MANTYAWVMSHTWMSHVVYMNESWLTHLNEFSRVYKWVMANTYEWVMSHIWTSHVANMIASSWLIHTNESCCIYERVMSHIWRSHGSHIWMNQVTYIRYMCEPWLVSHDWCRLTHDMSHDSCRPWLVSPWLLHICDTSVKESHSCRICEGVMAT